MNSNQPNYDKMPEHYVLCFNDECVLADTCLRRLAALSGRKTDNLITAVNPVIHGGENCKYYNENKIVTMAYGMVDSFHEVKADDIAALRNNLIKHFKRSTYYLKRNGLKAITPEEQKYISDIFRKFGYEARFDRTEETTQWD